MFSHFNIGDHVLGCGDGPLRIRRHDAICDVIWHALVQDNSGCKKEQCCGTDLDRLGTFFIQTFNLVSQPILMLPCVTLCRIPCFVYLLLLQGWLLVVVRLIRTLIMKLLCRLLGVFLSLGGGVFRPLVTQ